MTTKTRCNNPLQMLIVENIMEVEQYDSIKPISQATNLKTYVQVQLYNSERNIALAWSILTMYLHTNK